jgi:hypothetical protein
VLRIVVNSKYGATTGMSQYRATKEAVESLLAQLNSQSKLLCRDANSKAKDNAPEEQKLKIYRLVPKNIPREIIPLHLQN